MIKIFSRLSAAAIAVIATAACAPAAAQTGNVGIGTTNPQSQLHTTGSVRHEALTGAGSRVVYANAEGVLSNVPALPNSNLIPTGQTPLNGCIGGNGVASSIIVSDQPLLVTSASIKVGVNISHTYDRDVRLYLLSPAGDTLRLLSNNGGNGVNFTNTVFWDGAASVVPNTANGAPFSGTYKPSGGTSTECGIKPDVATFGAMGGGAINPNGIWRLLLFDDYILDAGRLISWAITFDGSNPPSPTLSNNALLKGFSGGIVSIDGVYEVNGNVGIGTTAPSQKLSVVGTIQATDNLIANGNVGIGIPNPSSPLHVVGNSTITSVSQSSSGLGTWNRLTNTSTGGAIWDIISTGSANSEGAGKLLIRSEIPSTVAATFQSNGNVGIGVSAPSQKLDVAGTVQATSFLGSGSSLAGVVNTSAPQTIAGAKKFSDSVVIGPLVSGLPTVARFILNGGNGEAFTIQNGGDMRIWNDNSTANIAFYAAGGLGGNGSSVATLLSDGKTFSFNGTAGSVSSDRRLKQDITLLEHSLEKVLRLNGYTYRFKTKADVPKKEAGVIAQEVLEVLPEAVSENADGTLSVSYSSLVPLLINAVKEQQGQIEAQRVRIAELEAKESAYAKMAAQLKEVRQMLGMQPKKTGAKIGRR